MADSDRPSHPLRSDALTELPKFGAFTDAECDALPEISQETALNVSVFGGSPDTVHERLADFVFIDAWDGWEYEILLHKGRVVKAKTGRRRMMNRGPRIPHPD